MNTQLTVPLCPEIYGIFYIGISEQNVIINRALVVHQQSAVTAVCRVSYVVKWRTENEKGRQREEHT